MLRNKLPPSLFFASGSDQYFPGENLLRGSACSEIALPAAGAVIPRPPTHSFLLNMQGGQYAPKSPDIVDVSLATYYFPENTSREIPSILLLGGSTSAVL
ncbi:MAG: hypothetical protein WDA41_11010, partial [Candidatus Neomarinimicrobiota bacterium]